jgi:hypothetical protein
MRNWLWWQMKRVGSRSDEDRDASGEDVMKVCATEKVEMKFSDCNAPYKRTRVSVAPYQPESNPAV